MITADEMRISQKEALETKQVNDFQFNTLMEYIEKRLKELIGSTTKSIIFKRDTLASYNTDVLYRVVDELKTTYKFNVDLICSKDMERTKIDLTISW